MKKNYYFFLLSLLINVAWSQNYIPKDSIYGSIKNIREKVLFLTEIENPQLLYYDDYGHSGFNGAEFTKAKFRITWFSSHVCYYINYEGHFNKNRKLIYENWYGKKDDFLNSYKKEYDNKSRIKTEIDSSEYSVDRTNYYYSTIGDINIISQNIKSNLFSHEYKKYKDGKLKILKNYNKEGTVYEYKYFYNDQGQLTKRMFKDPNSWKQESENIWSFGVQDTILTIYNDIINEYDFKNRIIKHAEYDLDNDKNENKAKLKYLKEYIYNGDNIVLIKKKFPTGIESVEKFIYDSQNNVVERYCCDKDVNKAEIIEKYEFLDGKISRLEYKENGKVYIILFKYKFDNNNNWTEIIKNVNGIDLYKWIRDIEYYE